MRKRIHKIAKGVRWVIAIIALITMVFKVGLRNVHAKDSTQLPSVKYQLDASQLNREGKTSASMAPIVKKVAPGVVKVFTTSQSKGGEQEFFNSFGPQGFGGPRRKQKQHGLGSGVVVSKDGYILTNNHVVENADDVKVVVPGRGQEFTASVIGTDAKTDIAVLKIEATDLPFVTLADSDKVEVGDLVLALGNPFGIGESVTTGIVSAMGRATLGMEYEDFIQTDAAINPGNSGGALVDSQGRLIGINTAILSRTGGNQGIGFAVPINLARHVMEGLVSSGRVVRGFLGVNVQDMTADLAREFGVKDQSGALVTDVMQKSPAAEAGLKTGDVVVGFDGKIVQESRQLKLQVSQTAPNRTVGLEIVRGGNRESLRVKIRELPRNEHAGLRRRDFSELP